MERIRPLVQNLCTMMGDITLKRHSLAMGREGESTPAGEASGGAGAAAFMTPCLLVAATVASILSQLGVAVTGGLSFTVGFFLLLDFLAYRSVGYSAQCSVACLVLLF